jgi:hypothetical protein
MNCPNCKQPATSEIRDGFEVVTCSTCGQLQINKDGSASPVLDTKYIDKDKGADVSGNDISAVAADTGNPPGRQAVEVAAPAPVVSAPVVEILGDVEDADPDSIPLNIHIDFESD